MGFTSFSFFLFLPVFFCLWPFFRKNKQARWGLITVASFIFYGWWDWRFIFLLLGSGLLDYFIGLGIEKHPVNKRLLLILSIVGNIGTLIVFKYLFFLTTSANQLLSFAGVEAVIPVVQLALPIGISFYTFQSLSYTIDIYRGTLKPTHNILHFFSFLAMFPQLVAGPIIRASYLLPQLEESRNITEADRFEGLRLITFGFFKKVVLADNIAPAVTEAYSTMQYTESFLFWWMTGFLVAGMVYLDFSGYSDIARGLGRWMGYDIPVNFNHPFISQNLSEIWRRWHISLSTWFQDYFFKPLGRLGKNKTSAILALWLTMIMVGLWHGAAWNFILWGLIIGAFSSIDSLLRISKRIKRLKGGKYLAIIINLLQVFMIFSIFRAETLDQSLFILGNLINPLNLDMPILSAYFLLALVLNISLFIREGLYLYNFDKKIKSFLSSRPLVESLIIAIMLVSCIFLRGPGNTFIYFQF